MRLKREANATVDDLLTPDMLDEGTKRLSSLEIFADVILEPAFSKDDFDRQKKQRQTLKASRRGERGRRERARRRRRGKNLARRRRPRGSIFLCT